MPRTLPAALTTVMDAGIYEPYIRVVISNDTSDTGAITAQPIGFKLRALDAEITMPYNVDYFGAFFRIERGAVINGTPSTITSGWFEITNSSYDGKFITFHGYAIRDGSGTVAANADYQGVIEGALGVGSLSYTASYEGSAAWKAYQFYPDGRTVVFPKFRKLETLLRQKYLIFATENGWNGSVSDIFFFVATDARTTDYTVTDLLFTKDPGLTIKKLIWRDEASTIHTSGGGQDLHNLGYLKSTASAPTNNNSYVAGMHSSKLPVHLKYRTGDKVTITGSSFENTITARMKVTEVLDLQSTPAWYVILEPIVWFTSTEGGSLPSTIEAAAPYTPLVTGAFNGILSENDNNLQAAMETIDDHDHAGGAAFTEVVQDLVGAMVSSNTETGIAVTYDDTNGKLDFALLDEYLQDTIGAMLSGNTESGITVTYQDSDGTIDFELDDWGTFTVTQSGITLGTGGTATGAYVRIRNTVHFAINIILGSSGAAVAAPVLIDFPVTCVTMNADAKVGDLSMRDVSLPGTFVGHAAWSSTTQMLLRAFTVSGTAIAYSSVSNTIPFTWANNDLISITGSFRAA